ncbi:MAG: hypothetical protein C0501_13490 [Isosphaera sp.]|nr:hypothetical protein [Isosphaera sp.]
MPDWLVNILSQFPIVVVVGLVAWFAYKEVRARHAGEVERLEAGHQAQVRTLEAALDRLLEAKDKEIARLSKQHRADMQKLTRKVDDLIERLDGRGGGT